MTLGTRDHRRLACVFALQRARLSVAFNTPCFLQRAPCAVPPHSTLVREGRVPDSSSVSTGRFLSPGNPVALVAPPLRVQRSAALSNRARAQPCGSSAEQFSACRAFVLGATVALDALSRRERLGGP